MATWNDYAYAGYLWSKEAGLIRAFKWLPPDECAVNHDGVACATDYRLLQQHNWTDLEAFKAHAVTSRTPFLHGLSIWMFGPGLDMTLYSIAVAFGLGVYMRLGSQSQFVAIASNWTVVAMIGIFVGGTMAFYQVVLQHLQDWLWSSAQGLAYEAAKTVPFAAVLPPLLLPPLFLCLAVVLAQPGRIPHGNASTFVKAIQSGEPISLKIFWGTFPI